MQKGPNLAHHGRGAHHLLLCGLSALKILQMLLKVGFSTILAD
jgi:hypothetical protein